ncbi:protein sidekick-1-like [Penaeus vannamei]|uniref:protein sidekick-1-like n=1 Tax=Penaeus vannamei TaxID=6689 RepID=UPI00387F733E
MSLSSGGTSLVISDARAEDEAEYRCRVHFRLSPTWTQRLLLTVPEEVEDVEITDGTGRPLPDGRLGPLPEGADLTLACQANHGTARVVSLVWLLEGVDVDSTWAPATKGVAINQLTISGLEQRHRNAHLTCRLTTWDPEHTHVAANITDASTIINMFYVPEATLVVEGGRHSAGGGREVMEGKNVMFICSVRADPPAYNITWLHNGRVVGVGGRRWRRDNSSLVVTPVSREDAGLYTCLASNTEGDGHSNAVLLRVAHTPYCSGNPQRHYVVAKNTTVTLTCQVEAVPQDLTFEWKLAAPPITPLVVGKDSGGGVVTGEGPPKRIPSLINLTPGHPQEPEPWVTPAPRPYEVPLPASWEETSREEANANEALLNHRLDPDSPTRSVVSITPTAPAQIICYARNRVGRTRVPCTYTLTVVEPPEPLKECNITNIEETRLEVKCDTRAHTRSHGGEDGGHVHHSPSLSFVRSPEASAQANLEVWSGGTLITNLSKPLPVFSVRGLPPQSELRLVLYAATPHARSAPVTMYTRTLPRSTVHVPAPPPPTKPKDKKKKGRDEQSQSGDSGMGGGLGMAIGGLVGGVGVMLLVLVLVIMLMRRRQARRAAEMDLDQAPDPMLGGVPHELLDREVNLVSNSGDATKLPLHTPPPPRVGRRLSPPAPEEGCSSGSAAEAAEASPAEVDVSGSGQGQKMTPVCARASVSPKNK